MPALVCHSGTLSWCLIRKNNLVRRSFRKRVIGQSGVCLIGYRAHCKLRRLSFISSSFRGFGVSKSNREGCEGEGKHKKQPERTCADCFPQRM